MMLVNFCKTVLVATLIGVPMGTGALVAPDSFVPGGGGAGTMIYGDHGCLAYKTEYKGWFGTYTAVQLDCGTINGGYTEARAVIECSNGTKYATSWLRAGEKGMSSGCNKASRYWIEYAAN